MNICYLYTRDNNSNCDTQIYEDMLVMSIDTLLMFYKNSIEHIYLLIDNNIKDEYYNNLLSRIVDLNDFSIYKFIFKKVDLNITNIFKYPVNNCNNYKINRIGLAKFLIPYFVDCDEILYIDSDVLFNKKNAIDDLYKGYDNKNHILKMYQNGWNSGIILFNCKLWRNNTSIIPDIIDHYEKCDNIIFVDNDTFGWLANKLHKENKCSLDNNWRINFPLVEHFEGLRIFYESRGEKFNESVFTDYCKGCGEKYDWRGMYVVHVAGTSNVKNNIFYNIYNEIKNTYIL